MTDRLRLDQHTDDTLTELYDDLDRLARELDHWRPDGKDGATRWPRERWQTEPCPRCGSYHPRHCPDCPNDPPCADHVCSWADTDTTETR